VTEIEENVKINKDMFKKDIESTSIKLFDTFRKEIKKLENDIEDVNIRFNSNNENLSNKINGIQNDLESNLSKLMNQNMILNDNIIKTTGKVLLGQHTTEVKEVIKESIIEKTIIIEKPTISKNNSINISNQNTQNTQNTLNSLNTLNTLITQNITEVPKPTKNILKTKYSVEQIKIQEPSYVVADKLSEELQTKISKMEEDLNNVLKSINELKLMNNELKLMSVDDVMKSIEESQHPNKEAIDRAIGNILKDRVDRSLSAPSRMIVKSAHKMYEPSARVGLVNNMNDLKKMS